MSDLDGRNFLRRGNTLVPADLAAEEFLSEIADGREIIVSVRKPRSPQHHRWFFKLLRKTCENTDDFASENELLDALKLATGHCERRMNLDGKVWLAPKSINFASMDQTAFKRFYNRCAYLLATKILGCTPEQLMGEVQSEPRRAA